MEALKRRITESGIVEGGDLINVDSFMGRMNDISLLNAMAEEFYGAFADKGVTKILTIETAGIPIATATALRFNTDMIIARRGAPKGNDDCYLSSVFSFDRLDTVKIHIPKEYIKKDDRLLIIDDILANGHSVSGLTDIVNRSEAKIVGIGVCIAKLYMNGMSRLEKKGYDIRALVSVTGEKDGKIYFAD